MNRRPDRILLIEGRPCDARLLLKGLQSSDGGPLVLDLADGVADALRRLEADPYDLVVLGLQRGSHALEELRRLRAGTGDTPVVLQGPAVGPELRAKLLDQGAHDYLVLGSLGSIELDLFGRCLRQTIECGRTRERLDEVRRRGAQLAQHDTLTGLPDQRLLSSRMQHQMVQARRYDRLLAVLCLDLDRFKPVNDSLGPRQGDQLLKAVARRLVACVRESDTVARRGGDEFTVLLDGIHKGQDAARVARKILAALARPYPLEERELLMSASIGIGLFPSDGVDAETLIQHADIAMYRAKAKGGNGYQFFLPEMNERAVERLELEQNLRQAIEREEFLLHYQPQIELASRRIVGMEALVRWQRPSGELVSPGRFIPVAEETGLIAPLGEWVLREACAQNQRWQEQGLPPVPVAVNLSAVQFQDRRPVEVIGGILNDCGLDPGLLDLELTESAVMREADAAIGILGELRDLGVSISIDDFGTGHSSLSYLKRFPITRLKIDRAFVQSILTDPKDAAITRAIVGMAQNLEVKAVAEGVETSDQCAFLNDLGCDEVQGFYFSRPLPAEEAAAFLTSGVCLN